MLAVVITMMKIVKKKVENERKNEIAKTSIQKREKKNIPRTICRSKRTRPAFASLTPYHHHHQKEKKKKKGNREPGFSISQTYLSPHNPDFPPHLFHLTPL